MNWIKENKFLTGFIAVLVIGAGVLGYLLYTAYDTYSDVTDQYTEAANSLHQLQVRVPYPSQENLAKYRAEHDDFVDATGTLATGLAQMVLPIEEITPSAFQDRLRDTVSTIVTKAGKTGVKLPEKFTMDFDRYQSQPPLPGAAGPLGRQLNALQIAMNILLDEHVDSVTSLQRTLLPQEGASAGAPAGGEHHGGGSGPHGGETGGGGGGGLVEKFSFEVRFIAGQPSFQKVLNDFAASSKQFFITRTLMVENTDPKPVTKVPDVQPAGPGPGQPGVASETPGPGGAGPGETGAGDNRLKFIVGTEKLDVQMRIDMVAFNPPEKAVRKGAGAPH